MGQSHEYVENMKKEEDMNKYFRSPYVILFVAFLLPWAFYLFYHNRYSFCTLKRIIKKG
jgi:hypothetical protein